MPASPLPRRSPPPEPFGGLPGAVVLFSDVACPWATVVVLRLHEARASLRLDDVVPVVHLSHPIELMYGRPLTRRIIDAEIPLCSAAAPTFGWSLWQGRIDEYPVSSLLACEALQVARRQSEAAAEALDLELRRAFVVESRSIMRVLHATWRRRGHERWSSCHSQSRRLNTV